METAVHSIHTLSFITSALKLCAIIKKQKKQSAVTIVQDFQFSTSVPRRQVLANSKKLKQMKQTLKSTVHL